MDTSMSYDEIKRKINSIKISINSLNSVIQKDSNCSNWQNLKDLIGAIDKDTSTLIGQQYFIFFDSSSGSSAAPNMTLEQAIRIMTSAETVLNDCPADEKNNFIFKVHSIKQRLQEQLNRKNSQLTVRPAKAETKQPTFKEMQAALSHRVTTNVPTTLSSYSTKIGGPSGAVGSSGAVDAERARLAALDRAELFKELAGSIHDVVEDDKINLQDLNTIASMDLQVELAGTRSQLAKVRIALDALESDQKKLIAFRPETLDALVKEMENAPDRHLNNQLWKDRLRNLLEYILTRLGEKSIGLVATLAKFFSTTRDEFISLIPATISAGVLLQILSGISWMGAPMGTGLSLISANMSFTQRIFDALAGNAQRIGSVITSFNSPLVAPLVVAGLLLIVVSLLPQKYMDKLRNLVFNLLGAIRDGSAIAIRNATALLIYAIDRLYVNRSQIFLGTCRLAGSVGRGLATGLGYAASGAMTLTRGVASGARNVARGAMSVARCLFPDEMLSIASTWMATQMDSLQRNVIAIFSEAASQAVTTAGLAGSETQLENTLVQLENALVQRYGIRQPNFSVQYQPISIDTIATIDTQVSQDNNDIRTTDDELLDTALDSAVSGSRQAQDSNSDINQIIQETAQSRASSRAGTPSNSQDQYALSPPPSPAYTPLNLTVTEQNNNIKVTSYNESDNKQVLQTTSDLTDNEESEDEGASSSSSSKKFFKREMDDSDDDLDGGRRRKSYRRKPKTSTKKKQYRRRTIRRLRNTRRRQKRNTKKKQYRRIRRR
jgi:hypothetical protein